MSSSGAVCRLGRGRAREGRSAEEISLLCSFSVLSLEMRKRAVTDVCGMGPQVERILSAAHILGYIIGHNLARLCAWVCRWVGFSARDSQRSTSV